MTEVTDGVQVTPVESEGFEMLGDADPIEQGTETVDVDTEVVVVVDVDRDVLVVVIVMTNTTGGRVEQEIEAVGGSVTSDPGIVNVVVTVDGVGQLDVNVDVSAELLGPEDPKGVGVEPDRVVSGFDVAHGA